MSADRPPLSEEFEMTVPPGFHGYRTAPDKHYASLNDEARLSVLRQLGLLHGAASPTLDRLSRIATALLDAPIALVSLVDDMHQHFPGLTGLEGWAGDLRRTPLSHSFCQHVVATNAPLLVDDASTSPLVADNLAVPELGVAAYAGVPLRTREGITLGAFCAVDVTPRQWTAEEVATLEQLAAVVMGELEELAPTPASGTERPALQTRDRLTGLLNVAGFSDEAAAQLVRAEGEQRPLALVTVKLLCAEQLARARGYDAGDLQLMAVAQVLKALLRDGESVSHVGNYEFLLLLPGRSPTELTEWEQLLRRTLSAVVPPAVPTAVSYTLGSAVWTPGELPFIAPVIHRAEMARRASSITYTEPGRETAA